jgi:6-phosphogluconolactonase (cycloisomerase 2 family)
MCATKSCVITPAFWIAASLFWAAPVESIYAQAAEAQAGLRHVGTTKHPGLRGTVTVALSPDGQFLYTQGFQAAAVNTFRRDEASGTLTHVQTVADPRIAGAVKLGLSRDGKMAAAACFEARSIGLFSRDAKSGNLELIATWQEQAELPLQFPTEAIFSTDNKFVYAVDDEKAAVVVFRPLVERRRLELFQNLENECFAGARGIAVHPDGKSLYITSHEAGTLTVVEREAENDRLRVRQILRDEQNDVHGLAGVMTVRVSGDGRFVYTTSGRFGGDDAISVFRVGADGKLSVVQEVINEKGDLKGFTGGNQLALSHDETKLYASGNTSGALACFNRDATSGRLEYITTVRSESTGAAGKGGPCGMACSADGRFLYLALEDAAAISVFERVRIEP